MCATGGGRDARAVCAVREGSCGRERSAAEGRVEEGRGEWAGVAEKRRRWA